MTDINKMELEQLKEESSTSWSKNEEFERNLKEFDDKYQLPEQYEANRMVLQVKNPEWIYVYWEYTAEKLDEIITENNCNKEANLILRVYNLTAEDKNSYYDIDVTYNHKDWYIGGVSPEHVYEIKLGILDSNDEFHTLLESNQIKTPANSMSDVFSEKWMTVNEKRRKIYNLSGVEEIEEAYNSLNHFQEQTKEKLQELKVKTEHSSFTVLGSS